MKNLIPALHGSSAALPTPYALGKVDFDALEAFCNRLIDRGIAALVPCGTTGEAPLLDGGRASSRRGADGRGGRRARAGDRRRRQQQHGHGRRAGALGGTRRRPGAALRHAALSQADPGRHDGAFPHHPRRGRPSHHPLRRALAHRLRAGRRDDPTARRAAAHRRPQGRHGRYPAGGAPAPPAGRSTSCCCPATMPARRRSAWPAATAAFR